MVEMNEICNFRDDRDFRHVGPPHADARERGYVQSTQGARVMDSLDGVILSEGFTLTVDLNSGRLGENGRDLSTAR